MPNREQWLEQAVEEMREHFAAQNYQIPPLRVTCGWPSVRPLSKKKRRIGECWDKSVASDNKAQIFISPFLVDSADQQGVLATLVHEVVHAVVGNQEGHNKVFGKCARAVGLEGKLTSTIAGESLVEKFKQWLGKLGEYPHAKLDLEQRPVKKQSTRLIKCECSDEQCGFNVRITRKWLDQVGAPECPIHGEMKAILPEEKEEDSDESGE